MKTLTTVLLIVSAFLLPAPPAAADTIVLSLFDVPQGTPCPHAAADGVVFVHAACDYEPGSACSPFQGDPYWGLFLGGFVALFSRTDIVAVEVDVYDSCGLHCTGAELYAGDTVVASAMNATSFGPATFRLETGGQQVTRLCVHSLEGFLRVIRLYTAVPPPPNDTMAGASGLSNGGFDVTGDTSSAGNDADPAVPKSCGPAAGPDVFYAFALAPGDAFQAEVIAETFAEAIYVLESGGGCVAYTTGGGKSALSVTNPGSSAREYYLVVDGVSAGDAGPFHLTGINGGFNPLATSSVSWGGLKTSYR